MKLLNIYAADISVKDLLEDAILFEFMHEAAFILPSNIQVTVDAIRTGYHVCLKVTWGSVSVRTACIMSDSSPASIECAAFELADAVAYRYESLDTIYYQ